MVKPITVLQYLIKQSRKTNCQSKLNFKNIKNIGIHPKTAIPFLSIILDFEFSIKDFEKWLLSKNILGLTFC